MRLEVLNTVHFLLFDILKHVDMGIKGCVLKSWIRSIFCFLIFQNMLIWVSKDASWRAEYGPFFSAFWYFKTSWYGYQRMRLEELNTVHFFSVFWYFKTCWNGYQRMSLEELNTAHFPVFDISKIVRLKEKVEF